MLNAAERAPQKVMPRELSMPMTAAASATSVKKGSITRVSRIGSRFAGTPRSLRVRRDQRSRKDATKHDDEPVTRAMRSNMITERQASVFREASVPREGRHNAALIALRRTGRAPDWDSERDDERVHLVAGAKVAAITSRGRARDAARQCRGAGEAANGKAIDCLWESSGEVDPIRRHAATRRRVFFARSR